MSLALIRNTTLAIGMLAACSSTLLAQQHENHGSESGVLCGTTSMLPTPAERAATLENTRIANPALYARIMSKSRESRLMRGPQYDEYTFLVRNHVTQTLEEVQGALVYTGPFSRVWVDCRDTAKSNLKPTHPTMLGLFKALDIVVHNTTPNVAPRNPTQGILKNDIDFFGNIPQQFADENKTDFLLLDIKDVNPQLGNVLGYFSSTDQTDNSESNRRNLLYIDSKEGFSNTRGLLGTIAHEFQHLIHYGRHPVTGTDQVFNEGLSEEASILNGYLDRDNRNYLANTNIDLFDWDYTDMSAQLVDYSMALTFVHYLSEQFGERLLYELVGAPDANMVRLDNALRRYGVPAGYDHRDVLKGFAVANYVQTNSNRAFSYSLKLKGGAAMPHATSSGSAFPATGSAVLQGYGTYYVVYNNAGSMKFRFGGSPDVRAMMIGYRAGDTTITDLKANTDYTMPIWGWGNYSRLAIALINTGSGVRDVNWAAEALVSGVDAQAGATAMLAIEEVSIANGGNSSIAYTVPSGGMTRIELFNVRGEMVRSIVNGNRETGSHREPLNLEGLANGTYVVRLVNAGAVASRKLYVAR